LADGKAANPDARRSNARPHSAWPRGPRRRLVARSAKAKEAEEGRLNEPFYTVFIDDEAIESFDGWPEAWLTQQPA